MFLKKYSLLCIKGADLKVMRTHFYRRKSCYSILCLLFFGLISPALTKNWKAVRIGVELDFPPFESRSPYGNPIGFEVDLGNALCSAIGAKCVWVPGDFDSMIPSLQARKIDAIMSSLTSTEKRRRQIAFSDKLFKTPTRMIAKVGSPLLPTVESLKGKSVGVLQGTNQEIYAKTVWEPKGVKIVSYTSQNQIYADMKSGRLDAGLSDEVQAKLGFLKSPEGQAYSFVGPSIDDPNIMGVAAAIGLRKSDPDLKAAFNKAIAEIRKNGTYEKIAKKYFDFDIYGQ
jgi:lysine-arginine-ornithine-binding protein